MKKLFFKKAKKIGLAEGEIQKAKEIAKKMKSKGADLQYIAEVTGLTNEEIEAL